MPRREAKIVHIGRPGPRAAPTGWPNESGVPGDGVASCPNFPECGCMEACAGDITPRRLALPEWILVVSILAALAIAAWIVLAAGGGNA